MEIHFIRLDKCEEVKRCNINYGRVEIDTDLLTAVPGEMGSVNSNY